ncbi:MAG TPA: hypothetical protein PKK48_07795, partial [Phycisphaerae bacterium]|nr:hypothetical protein [Phycisphaerae bacterium]
MRVGIRTKLVILLVAVALLPLLAELLTIVIGSRQMQNELLGKNVQSLVSAEVNVMEVELRKNIEILSITLQEGTVLAQLEEANSTPNDPQYNDDLDRKWNIFSGTSSSVRKILVNHTS